MYIMNKNMNTRRTTESKEQWRREKVKRTERWIHMNLALYLNALSLFIFHKLVTRFDFIVLLHTFSIFTGGIEEYARKVYRMSTTIPIEYEP